MGNSRGRWRSATSIRRHTTRLAQLAALAMVSHAGASHAACTANAPWQRILQSASNFVSPLPLALTGGAVLAPLLMIPTGVDHRLRLIAQDDLGGRHNLEPVSVATPYVLVAGVLMGYVVSTAVQHCESQRVQAAVLQSVAFTGGTVLLLKWATGRAWPNAEGDASLRAETSTRFEPFGHPYRAFPSGHTAVMFAASAAFRASLPSDAWYRWLGYPISVGVAAGMWLGDHHWASDIVSGGLLGEAIGSSVGRSFSGDAEQQQLALVPVRGGVSLQWSGSW